MGHRTPLYDTHLAAGGRIVDFGGWDMPVHYGSQIEEHHAVRQHAGMFDVSHMTIVDLAGAGSRDFLRHVIANDVDRLTVNGKALYAGLLNADGGVIDDLIVYRRDPAYRLVVNCGTREKDLAWLEQQRAGFDVQLTERSNLAMIAVQGPAARTTVAELLGGERATLIQSLKVFTAADVASHADWYIARTGYTGEDGLEIMLPATEAATFWQALAAAGVRPCGLGARDTLRLEAGMNLYGNDMDDGISPLACGMGWTLSFSEGRDFIGRAALEKEQQAGTPLVQKGLLLLDRGVLRSHQQVLTAHGAGEITSGTFSPTLEQSIALARLPAAAEGECEVEIRGKRLRARIVKPPFVRNGKKVFE